MADRLLLKPREETKLSPISPSLVQGNNVLLIPTGATLLNLGLNGGWACGRVANIVGDTAAGKCVRDAFIISKDQGLIYIDDLGEKAHYGISELHSGLALDHNEGCLTSHFYKEKVTSTIRFKTKHGFELIGTTKHQVKILLPDLSVELRRMDCLVPGDFVVIAPGTDLFPEAPVRFEFKASKKVRRYIEFSPPLMLTDEWAEFLGFIIADGALSSGPVFLSCRKEWKRHRARELCESIMPGAYRMTEDGVYFSSQVKEFVVKDLFECESLAGVTARYKAVPPTILRAPRNIQAAFLRAVLSCDSELQSGGLIFTSASRRLAREIQMMLLNFGVPVAFSSGYTRLENWEEAREYYFLSIHGKSYDLFLEKIGLIRPYERKKVDCLSGGDFQSIPYAGEALRREIKEARERLGWACNGKLRDGNRWPSTDVFSRRSFAHTREYISEIINLLGGLLEETFVRRCMNLLKTSWVFDRIEEIKEIQGEQDVFDVHVPEGNLFWCSGFISHNTLLAIEACANFAAAYGVRDIRYNESENAFSRIYAESIGLPGGIKFTGDEAEEEHNRHGSHTVEEFEEDFAKWLKPRIGKGRPCMYVLDSFDALEAASELKRDFGNRQPGAKAALASEFYRTHIAAIAEANCLFLMISQLRDAIGVMFGESQVRSGGKSHDFYASQIIWLATSKVITEKRAGVEREIGTHMRFRVKKNKVGKPHARSPLVLIYNYGVDDLLSCLEWLHENKLGGVGRLTIPVSEYASAIRDVRTNRDLETMNKMREELQSAVRTRWAEIDAAFEPELKKYP